VTNAELFDGHPVIRFNDERTRRNFLKWAGLIGVGATLVAAGRSRWASAQDDSGDVDILNYALTLEYLEADFYRRGARVGSLSRRERSVLEAIGEHERAHVEAITAAVEELGGKPARKPNFKYPGGVFANRAKYLDTGFDLQAWAVRAYHGQVTFIKSKALLGAAASIAGVESRHAAILADLTGKDPFPAPLEQPAGMGRVLEVVKPFVKN
jgi:predicted lactoylglutathione lyase